MVKTTVERKTEPHWILPIFLRHLVRMTANQLHVQLSAKIKENVTSAGNMQGQRVTESLSQLPFCCSCDALDDLNPFKFWKWLCSSYVSTDGVPMVCLEFTVKRRLPSNPNIRGAGVEAIPR
eukprot:3211043-Amphidinium_carterae.1